MSSAFGNFTQLASTSLLAPSSQGWHFRRAWLCRACGLRILMEDPYSHLSVLALALSLSSLWSLTLQGPPPPHSCPLAPEVGKAALATPTPSHKPGFYQHSRQAPLGLSSLMAIWISVAGKIKINI